MGDCNQIFYAPHDNGTIGIKEFRVLKDPRREELDESFAVLTDPTQVPLEGRWNISYKWSEWHSQSIDRLAIILESL